MADDFPSRIYGMTSPPLVYKNLVITGAVTDGQAKGPGGDVRAYDVQTGRLVWRFHNGKSLPAIALKLGIPPTGAPNLGGSIVTASGVVFIAATNDSRIRAFDRDSGKELWTAPLPASGHATPMTFLGTKSRKQFVVIAAGGGNKYNRTYGDALVAFALP